MLNENEKKGFFRFAYIENSATYFRDIRSYSHINVDRNFLDGIIDRQVDNDTVRYFNERVKPSAKNDPRTKYALIDTGYVSEDTGEKIYGGFRSTAHSPADMSHIWSGVEIGTEEGLLSGWAESFTAASLSDYTFIPNFSVPVRAFNSISGQKLTEQDFEQLARSEFSDAYNENRIFTHESNCNKPFTYFRSNIISINGEEIWFLFDYNKSDTSKQKWFGVYLYTRSSLLKLVFERNYINIGGLVFDSISKVNGFLGTLAGKAKKENWGQGKNCSQMFNYPILKSYIENTYAKLLAENMKGNNKIVCVDNYVYFNTRLLDNYSRQIFIVGKKEVSDIYVEGFGYVEYETIKDAAPFSENEPEIAKMFRRAELPKIAEYFIGGTPALFNSEYDIHLNDNHIFIDGLENGRLPKYFDEYQSCKNNPVEKGKFLEKVAQAFDAAKERSVLWAERNYNFIVPQYLKDYDEIQFLLPIFLGDMDEEGAPECVLALRLDKSGRVPYYIGTTILTLEMAYNNARLIAKPDVFWLSQAA